jgi:serine/threonine protein phosphatase 1
MRLLAIGDIHGCLKALDTLLGLIDLQPDDLLITLGDYVDRGPDSKGVLDRILGLHAAGNLIPLRGNHDEMMLQARDGWERRMWLACGGRNTLQSYNVPDTDAADFDTIPECHWQFLESQCRDYYVTPTHFFVHGNVDPDLDWSDQPTSLLYWEKLYEEDARPHCSGKIMVCGHTRQPSGIPLDLGHAVCIDTGVYDAHGWLTCLDVENDFYWQANQRGEHRIGWLEKLRS